MVQAVNIRKGEKIIRVHFIYNTDLIDIMREHGGWWFKIEKAWQFPIGKLDEIYNHLTNEKYNVHIIKLEEKERPKRVFKPIKQEPLDLLKNPDVVSIPGYCKECKQYHFIGRDGLCVKCWSKMKTKKNLKS